MNYKPLLVLLSLCCGAAAPSFAMNTETIGPMTVVLPAAWKREVRPDGTVAFAIGDAGGGEERAEAQFFSFVVPNAEPSAVHHAVWNDMLRQMDAPGEQQSGRSGRFDWSEMQATDRPTNQRFWYRVYTTKEGAHFVGIMVVANSAQGFRNQLIAMEDALGKAEFAGAPRKVPASTQDTPIVESWVHVEIRFGSMSSGALTDHILFFQNGIVVRTGVINGPLECYATLPVANLQSLPLNYGRWREDKTTRAIDITWQERPTWHLVREGGQLSLDGKKLLRLRPIDGAKLNGVYAYRPVGDAPSVLKLSADGRFEAGNLTESMVCRTGEPLVTTGSGSYEIRKWTLVLRFDNGVTNLVPLKIAEAQDLRNVTSFIVKSYEFQAVQ